MTIGSLFYTPIYGDSQLLMRRQWAELRGALIWCRTQQEWDQCLAAYSHKHWVEQDALNQKHGLEPMEFKIPSERK